MQVICRRPLLILILFSLAIATIGCGDAKMAKVTGTVTYKDKLVPNAHVSFTPVGGGQIASGLTDQNGRFVLGTMGKDDGALVGQHKIHVIARGPGRPLRPGEIGSGLPSDEAPGDPIIPAKYFTPETSGLTHEVVRGSNDVPLTLTD